MTDKLAREKGYIDVTFVNLTAQQEREDRRYHAIGIVAMVLSIIAGFLFWPMIALWETGEDVLANIADSGNVPFMVISLSVFAMTGILFGVLTFVLYRRKG